MGTHPIFESDFDCLTEKMITGIVKCARLLTKNKLHHQIHSQSTKLASTPSKASIVKNTAVCVGLCGIGDFLAQIFLNLDKLKASEYGAFIAGYDTTRTLHMAISAAFMGPWFAWWYPFLARNYSSVWTRLGLELLTAPVLHVTFLLQYSLLHFSHLPSRSEFIDLLVQLLQVDLLIYSPIALFNFAYIPV